MHILEIGADIDEDGGSVRLQDAAFRTVPRDQTTFLVWRVMESSLELLPRTHFGTFYDGDAYLIYSASLPGQPTGPDVIRREIKERSGECLERYIHMWCEGGARGTACVRRAHQLAAHLAAPAAVLYRETPTSESPRMLSYFKDGIRILRSRPSSGAGAEAARLFVVRGRRPVLIQLEPVSWSQLAADAVFLLDTPALLVLWIGRTANVVEKIFGAKIAYRMARGADKGMSARRIVIAHDGYEQTLPADERALLDSVLDLRARRVRPAAAPAPLPRRATLYRATLPPRATLATHKPTARLEEIKRAPLYQQDLADDGVYVVDGGTGGVWAWVGGRASGALSRGALSAARGVWHARHATCAVCATRAGTEPLEFAGLFAQWHWSDARQDRTLRAARSATTRLDALSLATNAWLAAETQVSDDGSGSLRAWRVCGAGAGAGPGAGAGLVELARPQCGVFFDRDCYLVLYTFHAHIGDQTILYYWMGGSSPNDLRSLGEKEAKDLYNKLGRLPVQAWVYQGKEPAHFLQIFKGRMITYVGSATDYDPTGRRVIAPAQALIRVSGQYAREARGVEVRDVDTSDSSSHTSTSSLAINSTKGLANGSINGLANGSTNGLVNTSINGSTNCLANGSTNSLVNNSKDSLTSSLTNISPKGLNNGSTNGLTNGSPKGLNNGSTNGLTNGSPKGLNNGSTNGLINGSHKGLNNGSTKGLTNGSPKGLNHNGSANGLTNGSVVEGSCYILRDSGRVWVWCAASATGDEREVAKNMAAAEHTLVMQGNEKADFSAALGARRALLVAAGLRGVERALPPRLFYVSLGGPGQYTFEEIISFSQYDLSPEMCCVLDAHRALYVWRGAHASSRAATHARQIALAYLNQDPAARDIETPIFILNQGRELPSFTGFFPFWRQSMWKGHKTFSAIVNALEGKSIVRGGNSALQSGNTENRFDLYEKYPLVVLRGPKEHLPPDVDPLAKELYLTHDDFVATFGLPYSEFRTLPAWKQKDMKKAVGLF